MRILCLYFDYTGIIIKISKRKGFFIMDKVTMNMSFDKDTKERLKQLAKEQHCNVSQLVTRWAWEAKLTTEKKEGDD